MSDGHVFVGFGFGPIQAGLFAREAFACGSFKRIAVAEIDRTLVDAVRAAGNGYGVNIAHSDGIVSERVNGVELLDPRDTSDRSALESALGEATEIATSLPSVNVYGVGGDAGVVALLARALEQSRARGTIVYTAENNNHAAETLSESVRTAMEAPPGRPVQYLNTVIGKMSRVVTDPEEVASLNLQPIAPGLNRAFLVEAFNHILVSKIRIENVTPAIAVFEEKDDLLPFEEAKLFGHNAIHALLGFMGIQRGLKDMAALRREQDLMRIARAAFLEESGAALCAKYAALDDPLFTADGYRAYADDLLTRITNPYLADSTERAARDPRRKLGHADRIFGTMRLALSQGIEPARIAHGAAAGLCYLLAKPDDHGVPPELRHAPQPPFEAAYLTRLLPWLWNRPLTKDDRPLLNLLTVSTP